jgi:tetratricopeptide (TPR) repeat protein
LQTLGRFDEALATAKRALSIDPTNGAAHFNFGNALYALGRYEDAEASYRQSIALAPDVSSVHKNLGGTLLALEQYDKALKSYERSLSSRKTTTRAPTALLLTSGSVISSADGLSINTALNRPREMLARLSSAALGRKTA